MTIINGNIYDIFNAPVEGVRIEVSLDKTDEANYISGNNVVSTETQATLSDVAGLFSFDLLPTDTMTPSGALYVFKFTAHDFLVVEKKVIPTSASPINYKDLIS